MAMTKAEQQRLEAAESALAVAMALGWPREPKPEPANVRQQLQGTEHGTLFVGWWYLSYDTQFRIGKGCSDGYHHSDRSTEETTTQGCGRFYFSRDDALTAARWDMCERFATALSRLDKMANDGTS